MSFPNRKSTWGGGDTLPVIDTTAVVKWSVDDTKLVRIEADWLTTGTTRVVTMPDANVDLADVNDVPVANLADGTDWELITWSAAWTPATVAVWTASQVLTSNWAWAAPTFQDAGGWWITEDFSAYISSWFGVTSTEATIVYNWEHFDTGSNFNTSTWEYTVPSVWTYRFDIVLKSTSWFQDQDILILQIQKNGTSIRDVNMRTQTRFTYSFQVISECAASDVIKVTIRNASGSRWALLSWSDDNAFFGYKLK